MGREKGSAWRKGSKAEVQDAELRSGTGCPQSRTSGGTGEGDAGAKEERSGLWPEHGRDAHATGEEAALAAPSTPDALHAFVERELGVRAAREGLVEGHAGPFDYLVHAFFEGAWVRGAGGAWVRGEGVAPDCVVWACRGGGKTFLGAAATLLDLLFKAGVQVRILGGSLEQSARMYAHLRGMLERPGLKGLVAGRPTARRVALVNGSGAEILAASETSVRGTRVQKIRCDEVDLFDEGVWAAAQLVTRSLPVRGPWGTVVKGSVEALSTMHRPFGPMWRLVEHVLRGEGGALVEPGAAGEGSPLVSGPRERRPVFRWGVVDVLGPCGPERACEGCALRVECAGRAKERRPEDAGHVSVEDALAMRARVGSAVWEAEMLCLRPRRTDSVYPEFDPAAHVVGDAACAGPFELFVAGMDFGYRSEAVVLLAGVDARGVVTVLREHAASQMRVREHAAVVRGWIDGGVCDGAARPGLAWVGVDPAGGAVNEQTGKTAIDVLKDAGLTVRSRRAGLTGGINLVRARLEPWAGDGGAGGPRLRVHRGCERLIECLARYHYPPGRPEATEPVKDGHDHACDALRYLVINLEREGPAWARWA
jgi:hypothetical protein